MMYDLGTRKLIDINKSLLMTIPASWIRNNGLSKGDKVRVGVCEAGKLVVTPVKERD